MALVLMQSGARKHLAAIIAGELNGATLHAYSNAHTPLATDTLAAYTQTTFSGYAPQTMNTWGVPFTNGAGKAESDHPGLTWTVSAGGVSDTIAGIYVTDVAGTLLYAEENPAGLTTMDTIGQFFTYVPIYTENSEF